LKITREIKTAILVISSICLFIWGYSFLKGQNLFNNHKKLFVAYSNVEGLAVSAPVTINGKIIGKVNAIDLSADGKLLVELQINEENFPISKSSIAQIYEPGFIGGKQIAIYPNLNDKTIALSGDTLLSDVKLGLTDALGQKLVPTQQKIEKLVVDADGLVNNLNGTLDPQTKQNLQNSIMQLNATLVQMNLATQKVNLMLAQNDQKITASLSNVERTTSSFAKISDDLEKAKLGATVKNLEVTLDNVNKIMANLQAGKGSMGKLLNDDAMYTNLTKTSKELELLLQDVRLHPTRYVNVSLFGKKEKPYTEPTQK
jgi:phospholipid/cholesterol/gamma-HCH transport system substrate-binding protein